jgi:hypothetical protein
MFHGFGKTAVTSVKNFTTHFPWISVSNNTLSVQLNHTYRKKVLRHQLRRYGTQRGPASRIQICTREAA